MSKFDKINKLPAREAYLGLCSEAVKRIKCPGWRLGQLAHFDQALIANGPLFEVAYAFHRSAEYTFRPVTLQNDVIPLNQNLDGISLVHLISLAK